MRVFETTRGVLTLYNINIVVGHLFYLIAMQVPLPFLSYNMFDNTFFGIKIIGHGIGAKRFFILRKLGFARYITNRIPGTRSKHQVVIEGYFNIIGFNGDIFIFNFGLAIQKNFFICNIKYNGIVRGVIDFRI